MKHPEEWLLDNIEEDDWNKLEENIKDSLWTKNVFKYMKGYAEYITQQRLAGSATLHPNAPTAHFG